MPEPRFRLGSTSYVYWDDILPNVRQLGPVVEDIELVLFETDGYSNLPDQTTIAALSALARQYDLTYTVHLPLDLHIAPGDPSLALARKIMALTRPLQPFAYIAHLDAREPFRTGAWAAWREACLAGLAELAPEAGGAERIAIENLERWDHQEMLPLLERLPLSFCLDIGHLWLQGLDVPFWIARLAPRTRVVHLHGLAERDHKSLVHVPSERLDAALEALAQTGFAGVVTLEVFSVEDFFPSRELVLRWKEARCASNRSS